MTLILNLIEPKIGKCKCKESLSCKFSRVLFSNNRHVTLLCSALFYSIYCLNITLDLQTNNKLNNCAISVGAAK